MDRISSAELCPPYQGGQLAKGERGVTPEATERLRWIDMLRGVAIMLMIAAHVADAFLSDAYRHGVLWHLIDGLFGFVAPGFLLLSGVALWIALSRNGDGALRAGQESRKLLRRALQLLLLGYWLQIPVLSLRQLIYSRRPDELARLFDANILQAIAFGIVTILALAWLLRRLGHPGFLKVVPALLGLAIVVATPYVWQSNFYLSLPLPVAAYAAPHPPALFPLFPYLAYPLAGFVLASASIGWGRRRAGWLLPLGAGALLLTVALLLDPILAPFMPFSDFWGASPLHFLFRAGGVVAASSVAMLAVRALAPRHTRWLEYAGRRSLAVYVVHLIIVYGSPVNMGLRYWLHGALNRTLTPVTVVALVLAIAAVTCLSIRAWEGIREYYPILALWGRRLWWGIFWAFFLLSR